MHDIRQDADLPDAQTEPPSLGFVAVRRKHRHPDQFFKPGIARQKLPLSVGFLKMAAHAPPKAVSTEPMVPPGRPVAMAVLCEMDGMSCTSVQ